MDERPPVLLVRTIARMFYEDKQIVCLDLFTRVRMMTDEHLARRMLISTKESQKLMTRLRQDHLLAAEIWNEVRAEGAKPIPRTFYYINYPLAIDATKARMHGIIQQLEARMREKSTGSAQLRCEKCSRTYTTLQASVNPRTMMFECDFCGVDLAEEAQQPQAKGAENDPSALFSEFLAATQPIKALLSLCDQSKIEAFDQKAWITEYYRVLHHVPESRPTGNVDTVAPEIDIEITTAEEEAERKRAKFTLPSWHSHSTVTGEQYVQEAERSAPQASKLGFPAVVDVPGDADAAVAEEQEAQESSDAVIMVNGQAKLLRAVTEEDQEKMSPEEYAAFYEATQK